MIRALPALAIALLLTACMAAPRGGEPPARELRVVTLNIYHDAADWPARLPLIVDGLRALDADVIALQEVLQTGALPNQAETIGVALGYPVHFVSTDPEGQAHRYGNALLTRLPVRASDGIALAPLDDARSLGWTQLLFDGAPVNIYFTHLHWRPEGGAIRERQLADAMAWIARTAGHAPSIVLGDFNAPADAPELQALSGFVDAYGARHPDADASTLNPHFFPDLRARIDLVFAERDRFDVRDARIVLDTPDAAGTWPSDHFGTFVVLRLHAQAAAR